MRIFLPLLLLTLLLSSPGAAFAGQPSFADSSERDVQLVANLRVMIGTGIDHNGAALFDPSGLVNRAQLAVVLQRAFQFDYHEERYIKPPVAGDYYQDVDNSAWYADAVTMCAINDIFPSGHSFMPDKPVSRLEVARAVFLAFQAKHISIPMIMLWPVFTDTGSLTPAELNAVVFVNNTGIMAGESGAFTPEASVRRSDMASVIARCIDLMAVRENQTGQTYQVPAGNTFVIALPSNPSTGYYWSLKDKGDTNIISETTSFYLADSYGDQSLVGQGGRHYWQFKAPNAGSTQIQFVYSRPWESVMPLKVFTLPILVR